MNLGVQQRHHGRLERDSVAHHVVDGGLDGAVELLAVSRLLGRNRGDRLHHVRQRGRRDAHHPEAGGCQPRGGAKGYPAYRAHLSSSSEESGSSRVSQPPPTALTSRTLAAMRRRRISISFRWFASAAVWAVIT